MIGALIIVLGLGIGAANNVTEEPDLYMTYFEQDDELIENSDYLFNEYNFDKNGFNKDL